MLNVAVVPTLRCPLACEYCYQRASDAVAGRGALGTALARAVEIAHRRGATQVRLILSGGEPMLLGPEGVRAICEEARRMFADAGVQATFQMQTSLHLYNEAWREVIGEVFGGLISSSMDYPNQHRKLPGGGAAAFERRWREQVILAKAHGHDVVALCTLNAGSLAVGARAFYDYFASEVSLAGLRINLPFPGHVGAQTFLDPPRLSRFVIDLYDLWRARGDLEIRPFAQIARLAGGLGDEPALCYFSRSCATDHLSLRADGSLTHCERLQTALDMARPAHPDLEALLEIRERVLLEGRCGACEVLAACHGGCPAHAIRGAGLNAPDPYCEVYRALWRRALQPEARHAR